MLKIIDWLLLKVDKIVFGAYTKGGIWELIIFGFTLISLSAIVIILIVGVLFFIL